MSSTPVQTKNTFLVSAIPPQELERIRARGLDDHGNPLRILVNERDGETPLRCCLREAHPGEEVALIAYRPSGPRGAYAETGPVFIHASACPGYREPGSYPSGFRHRRQLLRAYGVDGGQIHHQIVEPGEVDQAVDELLSRPEIEFLHSRNVLAGCYMFRIDRPDIST
jgi:hypothetical protein